MSKNKYTKFLNSPRLLGSAILMLLFTWLPDSTYLKILFYLRMGRKLHLRDPKTFNEKLQWLKLYYHRPDLSRYVDKITAKDYIKERLGEEYVVPTLKVWEHAEDITPADIADLPDRFVIKTTHSGGNTGVYICSDKSKINLEQLQSKMRKSLKSNVFNHYREWPYKNIKPMIIAEEYLGDNIVDYKFFCFNGRTDCVMLCLDRGSGETKFYFFDSDWKLKRLNKRGKDVPEAFTLPKPEGMDEMFRIADQLSEGHPFVRVDLYNINGKIYFGELTFYPASGLDANLLPETDRYFGSLISLPKVIQ